MAEKEILIRKADPSEVTHIFHIYREYMFDSFLLKFGDSFVKQYLKIIVESPDCITLVAETDKLIGFIIATFNSRKILFKLLSDIKIFFLLVRKFLTYPYLFLESLEFLFYPFNTMLKNVKAELLFISIAPLYRRRKLATKLIKSVLILMSQKGIKKVKVSALVENKAVIVLLRELGFEIENTFRLFRKYMYLYLYELSSV